ncbi:hypothetical protein GSY71_18120 [Pusillimonas sp. TS35]|uniref:hypothetical protein n=1 Tax=Paracandidimonas lactea TaxID=2895524 RepID=UPI00142540EA|nr:hypothetical protein [Paracandidimonas lactea]MYN15056.1 hypothetical protein [Pusillimonas sp. TS35]
MNKNAFPCNHLLSAKEHAMQAESLYKVLKAVGGVVLLLMVIAIGYAAIIGISYWSGIGV